MQIIHEHHPYRCAQRSPIKISVGNSAILTGLKILDAERSMLETFAWTAAIFKQCTLGIWLTNGCFDMTVVSENQYTKITATAL